MVASVNAAPVPGSPIPLSDTPIIRSTFPSSFPLLLSKPIMSLLSLRTGTHLLSQLNFEVKSSTKDDSETTSLPTEELWTVSKSKLGTIENKTSVFIYGGVAFLALWLSATVVRSVNSVPLLPKFLEIFGLAYTGWFAYRYLLFKENRKELAADIKKLTSKVIGTDNE